MELFWAQHRPVGRAWSRQYASIIFVHGEEQRRSAEKSKKREEERLQSKVSTEIRDFPSFWRAEDYHQKHRLRRESDLVEEVRALYPSEKAFVDSTVTARLNGYFGGHVDADRVRADLDRFGLSETGREYLLDFVGD